MSARIEDKSQDGFLEPAPLGQSYDRAFALSN